MDNDTYQRMCDMASGKIVRDQAWLDKLAVEGRKREEVRAKEKYEKQHPPARTHREIELEQRAFNLRMFGKSGMEKFAQPLDPLGELYVPSVDAPAVRLQEHSSSPAPTQAEREKMKMKFHAAGPMKYSEPIRQKMQLL
jgi:hypothetical protein